MLAEKLIQELHGKTSEKQIKEITIRYASILKENTSEGNIKRERTALRKAVENHYPSVQITSKETSKPRGYFWTNSGKGRVERYEHLALWYLTDNEERWEVDSEKKRKQYFAELPELAKPESEVEVTSEVKNKPTKLEDMKLEQLELDQETEQIVAVALTHSGMALSDFIRQACRVYSKTVVGKQKQGNLDLASIPTQQLKEDPKFKTHPGKAVELTKRAIMAIKKHNSQATELNQKRCITQSLITRITGSRADIVKEAMKNFESDINNHNATLKESYGLTEKELNYLNRKPGNIDFYGLVPDGLI